MSAKDKDTLNAVAGNIKGLSADEIRRMASAMMVEAAVTSSKPKAKKETAAEDSIGARLMPALVSLKSCVDSLIEQYRLEVTKGSYSSGSLEFDAPEDKERHSRLVSERSELAGNAIGLIRSTIGDEAADAVKDPISLVGYSEPPTSEVGIRNVVSGLASAVAGLRDLTDDKSARTALKDAQSAISSRARPANVEAPVAIANLRSMAELAASSLAGSFRQAHEDGNTKSAEEARESYARFRSQVDEAVDKKSSILIYATSKDTAGQDKDKIHRGLYKISKNVLRGASLDNIGAVSVCEGLLMLLSAFKGGGSVGKAMREVSEVYEEASRAEESLESSAPSERKKVFLKKHRLMKAALDSKREALQEDMRRYAGQPRGAEAERQLMALNGGADYGDLMNDMIDRSLGELHTERALHDALGAKHSGLLQNFHRESMSSLDSGDETGIADALAGGNMDAQQLLLEGLLHDDEVKNDGEVPDERLSEAESVLNAILIMAKRDPRAVQQFLTKPGKEGVDKLVDSMSEARRAVGSRMETYKALAEDDRERGIDRGPTGYGSHGLSIVPVSKVESEAEGDQQLQGLLARSKAHHFVRRKPWDAAVKDMLSNVKNLDGIRIKNNVFDPRKGAQEVLMWAKGMGGGVLRAEVVDQAVKAQIKHYKELFEKGGDGKDGAKAERDELLKKYDEEYQRLENLKEAESHVEEGWLHTAKIVQEAREKHQDVMDATQGQLDKALPKEHRDKLLSKQKEYSRRLYDKHFLLHDKLQDHTIPGDLDRGSLEDLLGLSEGEGTESLSDSDLAKLLASHMRGLESKKSRTEYKSNPSIISPPKAQKNPASGAAKAREHLKDVFGVLKAAASGTGVFSFNLREAAISNVGEYHRVPSVEDDDRHTSYLAGKFDSILSGEDAARRKAFLEETRKHYHGVEDFGDASESAAAGEEPLGDVLAKRHPLPGKLMRDAIGKIVRHDKALTHAKTAEPGIKVKRQRLVPEFQKTRHFLPEKPVHTVSDELEDLRTLRSMYKGDLDIMNNPEHPYSRLRERLEDLQSAEAHHSSLHDTQKSKVDRLEEEIASASSRREELEGKVKAGTASSDEAQEHRQVSRHLDGLAGKKDQFEKRAKQTAAYLSKLHNSISRTIQSIEGMAPDEKEASQTLEALEKHIETIEGEVASGRHTVGPNGEVPVYAKDIDELEENLFNTITEDLNNWKRKIASQQKVVDDLAEKIRTANKIAEEGLSPDAANIWAMELVGSMWQEIMNIWKSKKIQFGNLHQVDEIDWQDIMEVIKENVGLINDRALVSQLYELKELERSLKGLLNSGKVHSKDTLKALLDKAARIGGGKPFSEGTSERRLIENAMSGHLYDFKTILDNLRMRKRLVWVKMNSLRASREVVEVAKAVESVTKEVAPGKKMVDLKDAQDAVSEAKEAAASVNKEAADDQVQVSTDKKVPLTALGKLLVEALGW